MANEDWFNNEGKMTGADGQNAGVQPESKTDTGYGDPAQSYQQDTYRQTESQQGSYSQQQSYNQQSQQGSYYQQNQQNQQQNTYYQQVQPDDRVNYSNNQGGYQQELEEPISMGDWLVTLLLVTFVPCVNIVLMFVWAFSKKEKKSKSNYFKAQLIMSGIMIVFYIILFSAFWVYIAAIFSNMGYYGY